MPTISVVQACLCRYHRLCDVQSPTSITEKIVLNFHRHRDSPERGSPASRAPTMLSSTMLSLLDVLEKMGSMSTWRRVDVARI